MLGFIFFTKLVLLLSIINLHGIIRQIMAKITLMNFLTCLFILLRLTTTPKSHWFLLIFSIFKTLLKHPNSIFKRKSEEEQSHFLTDYLSHEIIVKSPTGIFFVARPKYEDLARFLFSAYVAKWEPISDISIKKSDLVIDIGANVGYYTLKLAPLIGESGKIISIEPDPNNFKTLKHNCELNHFINTELHNIALSDKQGIEKLFFTEKHSGKSSLFESENQKNSFDIVSNSLDNILNDRFLKIDLIKIDTEGAELSILKGAQKTLKITNKILIELHEEILLKNNQDPLEIKEILIENGFKITTFSENWIPTESSNKLFKSDYLLGEK